MGSDKKTGRPSSYNEDMPRQAALLCKKGMTDAEMAEFFGVTEQTVNNWKDAHPEFFESIIKAKAEHDNKRVVSALLDRALGCSIKETKVFCHQGEITTKEVDKEYPPDVTAIMYWLGNRLPKDWRYRPEPGIQGEDIAEAFKSIAEAFTNGPEAKEDK
ncbi:MAG: hypothetical protein PQJ60_10745 [Spirochaetales bacterium]|nr:hypothetical protein [Spirochaetales bacterium]